MATRKKLKKIKLNETITLLTNKEAQDISKIETIEQALDNKLDKNNPNLLSDEEKQKITNLDNTINGIKNDVSQISNNLENKVDKDGNKVLSDNNFSDEYKSKLDSLDNRLNDKVDKVPGKSLSTNDFTSEYKDKLDNLEQNLNSKIDKVDISDDLVTEDKTKVLSAKQGKELKKLLDSLNQSITNSGGTVIENTLDSDSETNGLSAKQGKELKHAIDNLQTLLTSDDTTLDSIQEIVNYIKQNRETLSQLSVDNLAGLEEKVNQLIVNSLDSDEEHKALSAAQGKALKELVDSKVNVTVEDTLNSSSTVNALSAAQGKNLKNLIDSKVSQVTGKSLSTNDFTNVYKEKLDNLQNNVLTYTEPLILSKVHDAIESIEIIDDLYSSETRKPLSANQGKVLRELIDTKVDKVHGKQLSTNDFTSDYKNKLDNLDNTISSFENNFIQHAIPNAVNDAIENMEIVDNLYSTDTRKPLSANQGRELKGMIDGKVYGPYTIRCLTQREYDQLSNKDSSTLYFIK